MSEDKQPDYRPTEEDLYKQLFLTEHPRTGFPLDTMVGRRYRHQSSGKDYYTVDMVVRERDLQLMVVYKSRNGYVRWERPLDEFLDRFFEVKGHE